MPFDAGPPPVPRPDAGDVGASCTRNSSCTQGPMAQCIPAQAGPSGGYCTASCTTDSDCGPGNSCQTASKDQFGDSNPFCTHTCNTDSDCRSGELCITYEGESFCWYACQTPGDCINSQTDTCDVVTGLCTGETAPGIEPYDAGPPCTPTGCGTKACQDTCGNFDSSCSTTCDSANQGYNSCGGVDPSCGSIPDAGPDAFVTIPLGGCPFLGYDAPVTIDSQSFQLDIDTGSTTTFVAASSCSSCRVTPEYSPPSGTDTGMSTQSQYGSGQVSGEVYLDQVRVGNEMPTVKLYFGGITDQQGFFIQESCSGNGGQQGEGLLGLGPIDLDTIGMNSNDAYFTDLVASAMGIKNVFAVNLCTAGGNLWFGGYDTSFASGPVTYTPLVNNGYWSVNITSIGLGTQTFSNSGDANSVVDTGTGTFLMPTNAYNALVSALSTNSGASTVFGSGALGQSFFNGNNCLQPRGGQSQSEIDAALPNLTVTLPSTAGGSFTLHMPATQSYLALMGGAYCPGVSDSGRTSGSTIWGAPGLRAYITVFDIGNSRIGFAPQSSCQ
jgi:cathepsin D